MAVQVHRDPAFADGTPAGGVINILQSIILWTFVLEIVLRIVACGSRQPLSGVTRRGLRAMRVRVVLFFITCSAS